MVYTEKNIVYGKSSSAGTPGLLGCFSYKNGLNLTPVAEYLRPGSVNAGFVRLLRKKPYTLNSIDES